MKIFPKRKTDKEYIESVRKSYKRRWCFFVPSLLLFSSIFAFSYYMGNDLEQKCLKMLNEISTIDSGTNSEENLKESIKQTAVVMSYHFGFRIGFLSAQGITVGLLGICLTITLVLEKRKNVMLLKYYDKNNNTHTNNNITNNI